MGSARRILILNERDPRHPLTGGAEIHVSEVFGRLAERGHSVTLAAAGFAGASERENVCGMDVWRLGRLRHYYRRVITTCWRETRRGTFDVVVECLNKVPFYSPVYSAVPVLGVCHHLFGEVAFQQRAWPIAATVWTAEQMIPLLYRNVPFVSISESSRDDLIRRGLRPEQVTVSHCGIRHTTLPLDPIEKRPNRVVYLGRLQPYKNVDVMLRAMALLSDRFPDAEILVIGHGAAQADLERLSSELGLSERTRFTGFVSDEERDALLATSRVCVFPSDKEGWGLTVIEANGMGTPVVASDAPGLRDSVRDGETGFLVAPGDVEGFAARIADLLSDEALAKRTSVAALAWAKTFDWERAADDMASAIEDLGRAQ